MAELLVKPASVGFSFLARVSADLRDLVANTIFARMEAQRRRARQQRRNVGFDGPIRGATRCRAAGDPGDGQHRPADGAVWDEPYSQPKEYRQREPGARGAGAAHAGD